MIQERTETICACRGERVIDNWKGGMKFSEESIISSFVCRVNTSRRVHLPRLYRCVQ
jgi:hypothetical protein